MAEEDDVELPYWSRTYCGFRERFVEPYVMQLSDTASLSLRQAPCVSAEHAKEAKATSDGSCTASTVWDAGIVLAAHVYEREEREASGQQKQERTSDDGARTCLDLGSGTGIVGLAAAASGVYDRVVLTDLPSVLPLLEQNAERNRDAFAGTDVSAVSLRWDDDRELHEVVRRFGPFDLIVGGDLLYRPQVVAPLLTALRALATTQTTVLLAASLQHSPETIRLFSERAEASGYTVERLGAEAHAAGFASEEVRLLRLGVARRSVASTQPSRREATQGDDAATSRTSNQPGAGGSASTSEHNGDRARSAKRARVEDDA